MVDGVTEVYNAVGVSRKPLGFRELIIPKDERLLCRLIYPLTEMGVKLHSPITVKVEGQVMNNLVDLRVRV